MPDSSALDVLVGLALIFAAFSLVVSRLNEVVLSLFHYRGLRLERELRRLLGSDRDPGTSAPPDQPAAPDLATELLDGPLRVLRATGRYALPASVIDNPPVRGWWASVRRARRLRLPSYVSSTAFAQALLDRVDPPARAMLTRLRPETLPADVPAPVREAYQRAHEAARRTLNETTAQALYDAMPADHPAGRVMAAALVTAARSGPIGTLEDGLAALPPSPARAALTAAIVQAAGDREKAVAELARWYDEAMDRLSGWYKRHITRFLLAYAIVLTAVFNLDALAITRALWQDGTVRQAAVAAAVAEVTGAGENPDSTGAGSAAGGDSAGSDSDGSDSAGSDSDGSDSDGSDSAGAAAVDAAAERTISAIRDASGLSIPVGWAEASAAHDDPREVPDSASGWLRKLAGFAISLFALTAGAPFWFDLLDRLVNMRATGPRPRAANS